MAEYIRKQAAIDAFKDAVNDVGILDAEDINTVFQMLPSIDAVEVRHGTWIEDRYNNLDYVCSECGEPCAGMVMGKPRDRYCKWCGAKMNHDGKGILTTD